MLSVSIYTFHHKFDTVIRAEFKTISEVDLRSQGRRLLTASILVHLPLRSDLLPQATDAFV